LGPMVRTPVRKPKLNACACVSWLLHLRPQAMQDFFARRIGDWASVQTTFLLIRPSRTLHLFHLPLWKFALNTNAKVSSTCALCLSS
jgi:hypothetical protein